MGAVRMVSRNGVRLRNRCILVKIHFWVPGPPKIPGDSEICYLALPILNLGAGNWAFATQSRRKCHKSGNLAVSEVCLYKSCVPVPYLIGLIVPRHALICHFRVSR